MSTYHVLTKVLDSENIIMNQIDMIPILMKLRVFFFSFLRIFEEEGKA